MCTARLSLLTELGQQSARSHKALGSHREWNTGCGKGTVSVGGLATERYSSPHEHLDFFLFSEVKYEAVLSIFYILKCKKFAFIKELTLILLNTHFQFLIGVFWQQKSQLSVCVLNLVKSNQDF